MHPYLYCIFCKRMQRDAGWTDIGWCCRACWEQGGLSRFHGPIENCRSPHKKRHREVIHVGSGRPKPTRTEVKIEEIVGNEL